MLQRLKAALVWAWKWYRHIAAARGLLQWTGWWESVTALLVSACAAVGSLLKGLQWPVALVFGLGAFAFVSVIIRIWWPASHTKRSGLAPPGALPPLPDGPPRFDAAPELRPALVAAQYRVPTTEPPLSEQECCLGWSASSSAQSLRFYVWNGTPHSSPCKVQLVNTQRWSDTQKTFVDTATVGRYAFFIFESIVAPEKQVPSNELVVGAPDNFQILSTRRGNTEGGYQHGRWRLELSLELGRRRRSQHLDFEWSETGLSPVIR